MVRLVVITLNKVGWLFGINRAQRLAQATRQRLRLSRPSAHHDDGDSKYPSIVPVARYSACQNRLPQTGTSSRGSMRSSASCRYSACTSLCSVHTGTLQGLLLL